MIKLIGGVLLLTWGLWCIIAAIQGKDVQAFMLPSDEFLPKKILGKYYAPVVNILTGTICIIFGVLIISGEF